MTRGICALAVVSWASFAGLATASAQDVIVVPPPDELVPPHVSGEPQPSQPAPVIPEPPASTLPPPGRGAAYATPDGTMWVPVPPGHTALVAPQGFARVPYEQPRLTLFDLEPQIDRKVRRARRAGFVQLAAAGVTLVAVSAALVCETSGGVDCYDWWSVSAAGFVGFSAAGIVSAFSANRAAGLLARAGVPIRRGAGRFAVALSFVPYANIGAFAFTSITLGRVRRARAAAHRVSPLPAQPLRVVLP